MAASLERVRAALAAAGAATAIRETPAGALGQIVKSILFAGIGARLYLFLTPGGRQVDLMAGARLAGEPLVRADPGLVRRVTGFAIGGVAPLDSLTPLGAWADPLLLDFAEIWAAAGTPHHVFALPPRAMVRLAKATVAPFTAAAPAPPGTDG